jgi:hypothetical protein
MARKKRLRNALSAQIRWPGGEVLEAARELNARYIELLAQAANGAQAGDTSGAIFGCVDLWAQLTFDACERAGRCPVVLLNVNFERTDWWRQVRDVHIAVNAGAPGALFDKDRAAPLIREILTEARSAARTYPAAARLAFGMTAFVSRTVADLSAAEIERISLAHTRELRPRWADRPSFWKRLLEAAITNNTRALPKIHLHCVQLLGRDLQLASG